MLKKIKKASKKTQQELNRKKIEIKAFTLHK